MFNNCIYHVSSLAQICFLLKRGPA